MQTDVLGYLQSKGLNLKPAGGDEYHVACFFHGEDVTKRGRLYINCNPNADILGLFECKVCDAHGSLATIKKHFGDYDDKVDSDDNSETRLEIMRIAAQFYHDAIADYPDVLRYLKSPERGLTLETVMGFAIGYASDELLQDIATGQERHVKSRALYRHLRDLGYEVKDILSTGLVLEDAHSKKLVDSLSGMITIPYRVAGNVVSIRGRAWPYDEQDHRPKYKTCGGDKARLFNSDVVWHNTEVVITEGEFDAMVLTQLGFPAVGVPGAKSWQDAWDAYVNQMRRVWIVLDRDAAGEMGAQKLLARFGSKARRIHLSPEGVKCDPTEWVAKGHTAEEFRGLLTAAQQGGLLVTVDQAIAEFRAVQGATGLRFGFETLDEAIAPGLLPGQLAVILAKTGCMAADTLIPVNRAGKGFKIPIGKMFQRWDGTKYAWDRRIPTFVQRAEGKVVRLGRVSEVWESGVKPVWEVRTSQGRSVAATAEHPFLTPGGWRKLGDLEVGDQVLVNSGKSTCGRAKKPTYYIRSGLRFHPNAGRRTVRAGGWSVPLHRLVVEARMNGFDLNTFLTFCREGPTNHLVFLDPFEHVHHLDSDPHNNNISNLKVLTAAEHHLLHAEEGTADQVLDQVGVDVVTSVVYRGEEMTYDISVEDDPHNFIANEFVVHNTGKTIFLLNTMHRMATAPRQNHLKMLFVSLEQTRGEWWDRARRIYRFYNLDATDEDAAEFWRERLMIVDRNRLSATDLRQVIDDFDYQVGKPPDGVFLDYIGYWGQSFKGDRYQRTSDAIMTLKEISKDTRIPIIAPHQVSRVAKNGEEFDSDGARDSGVIEETSDFVFVLWSPDYTMGRTEDEKQGIINMKITKSRHGSRGLLLHYYWAPLSLCMVPQGDKNVHLARDEMLYASKGYRDTWETAHWRHQTGLKGPLDRPGISKQDPTQGRFP